MQNTPIKLATLATLLIGPTALADYPATVLASNPLAYYRFEEAPGATTLVDSSGNGLDIDNSFPAGTTVIGSDGAVGSAVTFNGDGYLISPLNLDTSVGDFTIEAIIKRTAGASEGVVIANQDGDLGPGRSNLVVNGGGFVTTFSGGSTTNSGVINTGEAFDHVILTFDQSAVAEGVDPTFRFFINGAEAGTGTAIPEAANGSGYDGVGGDSARTLAFWFKGDLDQPNLNATLLSWGTGATGARFDTRINTAGVNQLRTEVAGSGSNATTSIVTGEWHHCTVVFDPVLGTTIGDALFYVDGNLEALTASGGTTVNTNASNGVRIGSARTFPGRAVAGKMDDIRIYDRALSEDEILSLITPGNGQELKIIAIRQLENGNVEVDWKGAPGDYFFEYSFDLTPDSWLEISDSELILQGESMATSVDDFIAPNAENRKVFYRLRPVD
ncbi:LamG domain-containing protein [Akkermansiaceae bacterium]|nr:LamG domain-containing protein [Akkermansiaceae bacterium]